MNISQPPEHVLTDTGGLLPCPEPPFTQSANEWVRDLCDKRATPCGKCAHRRFLPVTDATFRQHLTGHDETGREFIMGVYPMLMDDARFCQSVLLSCSAWRLFRKTGRNMCHGRVYSFWRHGNMLS